MHHKPPLTCIGGGGGDHEVADPTVRGRKVTLTFSTVFRSRFLIVLASAAVLVAGCAADGRELAQPADWQTTTTRPPPPTSALPQEIGADGLTLSSPLFEPAADIPVSATCAGDNIFPTLEWTDVPPLGVELALSLSDQTDPDEPVLLWLMAGIDPSRTEVESGTLPTGAFETLNDFGNLGFGSPCLESFNTGLRDLQFRLYVLSGPSGVAPGDPGNEAWATIKAAAIDSAALTAKVNAQA